ncbi:thermonuclease family protein [Desulfomonile tiedjei]|uniref:Micrococcal nuclease-like nuclease n=1 Tax=Desulfomonile tiedjei (strain ATCC 49306 / DSM 6799 / DCB-1) TaxID=706587 RepID=I4C654_DESTA|nr:thermonuclease family protein [Desulfomonile tiedjei]AFM25045.1 micrococcal nuclease-like nuclease [Desulfomonile tiedjei DSM 6799]
MDYILGYLLAAARWLLIVILTFVSPEEFASWEGTVIKIVRPDEVRVKRPNGDEVNVRLYGIDCPLLESGQPFAKEAMQFATDLLQGKEVTVQPLPGRVEGSWYYPSIRAYDDLHWERGTVKYTRVIGLVYLDGKSVSEEFLERGMAWWYKPFVPFERGYKHLEDTARENKTGLWAHADAVPPWEFQQTPITEKADRDREPVHPWVTRSGSIAGMNQGNERKGIAGLSRKEDQSSTEQSSPIPGPEPREPEHPLAPSTEQKNDNVPQRATHSEPTETKAMPESPADPVRTQPDPPCHKMLGNLKSLAAQKETQTRSTLEQTLGPAIKTCTTESGLVLCFRCSIVGRKSATIEVLLESEESRLTYRYNACQCERFSAGAHE